ncbi:hypothetical protein [Lacrimispora xylanolytica]|uniref:Uncharacterized protein n=1 Tax=Lacrimispora xylanolytica TaxID=29375 RepID=A0ABY7AEE9_9FIRM|nr:hypothetical protein [Lacrimispora xylanolytica]WAJ24168.1 hypothetical protein OW255_01170 [Lacrimispora xylanolytica]
MSHMFILGVSENCLFQDVRHFVGDLLHMKVTKRGVEIGAMSVQTTPDNET